MTIHMLHVLITSSINEVHSVLELHSKFLPTPEELEDIDNELQVIERPEYYPQVNICKYYW